ncbi:MAG: ABC transporter ATP-binding protein [Planctomycetota bacterium]
MSTPPILELQNVCHRIGTKSVLTGISISVGKGEYLSLIGPNGAGKTTLLKILCRILKGAAGEIRLNGSPLASFSPRDLARRLAYVPQADGRVFPFTVRDFVLMGRYPWRDAFAPATEADHRAAAEALELTGMESFADRRVNGLSAGERQKAYLAAALAQGTDILLLDEPATFLDPRHEEDIIRTLKRLHVTRGLTILSVTHDINRALHASTRVLALKNGSVAFLGSPAELARPGALEDIFGFAFTRFPHPDTGKPLVLPKEMP